MLNCFVIRTPFIVSSIEHPYSENMTIRQRKFTILPHSSHTRLGGKSDDTLPLPLRRRVKLGRQSTSVTKSIFAFCCGALAIVFTLSYLQDSAFFASSSLGNQQYGGQQDVPGQVAKTNSNTQSDGDRESNYNVDATNETDKTTSSEAFNVNTKSDLVADKKEEKDAKNKNDKPSPGQKAQPFLSKKGDRIEHELHPVANLNCYDHGGPTDSHIIDEMIYWVRNSCLLQNCDRRHDLLAQLYNTHNVFSFTPTSRIYPPMQTIYHQCTH